MRGSHTSRRASGNALLPRRLRYWAAGAIAAVALLAGGAATLLTFTSAPATHPLAADCGLVTCDASLPPAVTGLAVHGTARSGGQHHPAHRPSRTRADREQAHAPAPVPTPIPTPTALDQGGGQWQNGGGDGPAPPGDRRWRHGDRSWHHGAGD